jgi:hypothetical protein
MNEKTAKKVGDEFAKTVIPALDQIVKNVKDKAKEETQKKEDDVINKETQKKEDTVNKEAAKPDPTNEIMLKALENLTKSQTQMAEAISNLGKSKEEISADKLKKASADISNNLANILKEAGINPDDVELTVKEKKTGKVLDTENSNFEKTKDSDTDEDDESDDTFTKQFSEKDEQIIKNAKNSSDIKRVSKEGKVALLDAFFGKKIKRAE